MDCELRKSKGRSIACGGEVAEIYGCRVAGGPSQSCGHRWDNGVDRRGLLAIKGERPNQFGVSG